MNSDSNNLSQYSRLKTINSKVKGVQTGITTLKHISCPNLQ